MGSLITIVLIVAIQLFPLVRRFLPQQEEDWLFQMTRKHEKLLPLLRTLLRDFSYYQALSAEGQRKFERRVLYIIFSKTIVGAHDFNIDQKVAIRIIATMVQLTFGMKRFSLSEIKKILVYPDTFHSRYLGKDVVGLTVGMGFIHVSWKHGMAGMEVEDDNRNLLLHEFAHALIVQLKKDNDTDNKTRMAFVRYGSNVYHMFKRLSRTGHDYIREEAFRNRDEFFAVCVEHFFETPQEFKRELPKLYAMMCKLLNQDPTKSAQDYRL